MRDYDELVSTEHDFHDLADVLPDTPVVWSGFPLRGDFVVFHWNLLTRWRCSFTRLYMELHRFVSSSGNSPNKKDSLDAARDLEARWRTWYASLPIALSYLREMPIGLFEFQ